MNLEDEEKQIIKQFGKQIKMRNLGSGKLVAKIKFIGPDGVLRKFNEDNIFIITLRDNKGKFWTLKND